MHVGSGRSPADRGESTGPQTQFGPIAKCRFVHETAMCDGMGIDGTGYSDVQSMLSQMPRAILNLPLLEDIL